MRLLTGVVDLSRAGIHSLQEFVHLVIGHLLAEICENVLELTDANEACHVLVEDLETTAVLFRLTGIAEAARAVQDALEGLEVDCAATVLASSENARKMRAFIRLVLTVTADILLEVLDLSECWVLPASAKQITKAVERNTTVAALVEKGESLLVVGRSLSVVLVRSHDFFGNEDA